MTDSKLPSWLNYACIGAGGIMASWALIKHFTDVTKPPLLTASLSQGWKLTFGGVLSDETRVWKIAVEQGFKNGRKRILAFLTDQGPTGEEVRAVVNDLRSVEEGYRKAEKELLEKLKAAEPAKPATKKPAKKGR